MKSIKRGTPTDAQEVDRCLEVIYADVLFALNFCIDYLLLGATAKLAGLYVRRHRLAAGALVGAGYAVVTVFPIAAVLLWIPVRFAVGIWMVYLAYGVQSIRQMLKRFLLFLLVSFGFAGCTSALYCMTGTYLGQMGAYYFDVPLTVLLSACILAYVLSGILFRGTAKHGVIQDTLEVVEICFLGKQERFQMLLDSGNDLTDPISGKPVLVLERHALARILSADLLFLATASGNQDSAALFSKIPIGYREKFCLLPYHAVGTNEGLLLALRPECVRRQGKPYDALIALTPHPIAQGRYEGLIGL